MRLVLSTVLTARTCAGYQLLNSSTCLPSHDQGDRPLLMACPVGHLVKLVRLTYGHSGSTGRCHFISGDCVTHLVARGNEVTCVGLNRCDVRVTSRDDGRPIPGCQLPTSYIHASFQCIPGMGTRLSNCWDGWPWHSNYQHQHKTVGAVLSRLVVEIENK